MRLRPLIAFAAAAMVALVLAGCAQNSTAPVTDYRGEPKGVAAPASSAGGAPFSVWLDGGKQFTVTMYGSAGCPPVATRYRLVGHNQMVLTVTNSSVRSVLKTPGAKKQGDISTPSSSATGAAMCAPGYVPHTTVFATPNTVDVNTDVSITGGGMTWVLSGIPVK
jgi:hypothetical protein